jgi:hypothetical protein
MRLLTRTLWRAFPELDGFDDAQCARFVRAAARPLGHRLLRWALVLLFAGLGALLLPLALLAEGYADRRGWIGSTPVADALTKPRWMAEWLFLTIIPTLCFSFGGLLGLLTRDVLLRLRVRAVLGHRGRCERCRYFLGGLPVGADLKVTCPECGQETLVDASLGELQRDAAGAARFAPAAAPAHAGTSWWRSPRARRITKRAAQLGVGTLILGALILGANELHIRRQAAQARALRPSAEEFNALTHSVPPLSTRDPPLEDTDTLLLRIATLMNQTIARLPAEMLASPEGGMFKLDSSDVLPRTVADEVTDKLYPSEKRLRELREAASRHALSEFIAGGVFQLADQLAAAAPPRSRAHSAEQVDILTVYYNAPLAQLRVLAGWECALMRLAVQGDDPQAFDAALRRAQRYAQIADTGATLAHSLTSVAMSTFALNEVRAALIIRSDARWIAMLHARCSGARPQTNFHLALKTAHLQVKDMICATFSDHAIMRFGARAARARINKQFASYFEASDDLPLGTLRQNLDANDAMLAHALKKLDTPHWELEITTPQPGFVLLYKLNYDYLRRGMHPPAMLALESTAITIQIAIERHRLERGLLPAKLNDLVPAYLPAEPVDPWNGKAFGYRLIDPTTDPQNRSYLLYSYGADGVDNNATSAQTRASALGAHNGAGTDLILNDLYR